jgi:hypothetical protein
VVIGTSSCGFRALLPLHRKCGTGMNRVRVNAVHPFNDFIFIFLHDGSGDGTGGACSLRRGLRFRPVQHPCARAVRRTGYHVPVHERVKPNLLRDPIPSSASLLLLQCPLYEGHAFLSDVPENRYDRKTLTVETRRPTRCPFPLRFNVYTTFLWSLKSVNKIQVL